jgi:hypothetical protein
VCEEPYKGFFDELADHPLNETVVNRTRFKEWMKMYFQDRLMANLTDIPPDIIAYGKSEEALDGLLEFILDGTFFSSDDFEALLKAFNVTHVSRLLGDERAVAAIDEEDRVLAPIDEECRNTLLEIILDVLVLALGIAGLSQPVSSKIVRGVAYASTASASKFGAAFALQYTRHSAITKDFIISAIVTFFTTVEWWEIEKSIKDAFQDHWDEALTAILEIMATMSLIYLTQGAVLVVRLAVMIPSMISLFKDVADFLANDCFGDTQSETCDNFVRSGGVGTTTATIDMKQKSGTFRLAYEMYPIPDEIELFYQGESIYWSGGLVSGYHEADVTFNGRSQLVLARITAPFSGTAWEFSVSCPIEL